MNGRLASGTGLVVAALALLCAWPGSVTARQAARPAASPRTATQVRVTLITGDNASAAGVSAVEELRRDAALTGVTVRVLPSMPVTDAQRRVIRESDLLLVYTHERTYVLSVADEIKAAMARGALVVAIGGQFDPDIAEIGFPHDGALSAYFEAGGKENLVRMVRAALARRHRPRLTFGPPIPLPEIGHVDAATGRFFSTFDDYAAAYAASHPGTRSRPWVGLFINRSSATSGQLEPIRAVAEALETRGFKPVPAFGYPSHEVLAGLFADQAGQSRIEALVAFGLKLGNLPDKLVPVLTSLNVPVLNAISLYQTDRQGWEASPAGIDFTERSWQLNGPELGGVIAPTVVATQEKVTDRETGLLYVSALSIPERVERLADRTAAWVRLRRLANREKRVALVYYNYPPGRSNVGASYLNVLPQSLGRILDRLRADGYDVGDAPGTDEGIFEAIRTYGTNPDKPGAAAASAVERLALTGRVVLLPVTAYRRWFDRLPASIRQSMIAKWGEPEASPVMTWRNANGQPYFVFPALRWGKILLAAQPTRGWDQDINAAYHDLSLPPHHQYLAFYLWLQQMYRADAMVHVGTHGTHEWLPGKEVGFTEADFSEVMVGAVPQLYPYIVDNIGEGQQAKRRGMAAVITHMTPPLDTASLSPELREIMGRIGDYHLAREKGSVATREMLIDLAERSTRVGLLKDLGITLEGGALLTEQHLEDIEHHIKKIGEKITPFGLHTFGVAPDERMRRATADAILSLEPEMPEAERALRRADLMARLEASARAELDALAGGLSGRYIPAGPGNDPVRNPDSLPTGRNFYGFDPSRLPTTATYAAGRKLADQLMAGYAARHRGVYPDRLVFNLWATETNRHEGAMEGQILSLMGVRPTWDLRGRVSGVELIPDGELEYPRVDVTVVPSGLYRDLFPTMMLLIDQAVNAVKGVVGEDASALQRNVARTTAALVARGVAPGDAERMASVRVFTEPSGSYGTGLENVIAAADTWDKESDIAAVYFRRMGHLFGQGFWGDRPTAGGKDLLLAEDVFKAALSGAKGVIHSRSSNIYGVLDNDDVYQYLGGTAMAIRQLDGATPETLVSDLSNPKSGNTVTLDRFLGEEMRTRYLNPKWVTAMLKEGYAGARMIRGVVDNLWGWQVTVPEAVDAAKWQEMAEVYVDDRYGLGVRDAFRSAKNIGAMHAMVQRMLVAVDKGYWKADAARVTQLRGALAELDGEVAAENARVDAAMEPAPGLAAALAGVAPGGSRASGSRSATAQPSSGAVTGGATSSAPPPVPPAPPDVTGRVLEARTPGAATAPVEPWSVALLGVLAGALSLVAAGWWRESRSFS